MSWDVVAMTHQHAVSVVAAPLATVEHVVRDVVHWPRFLLGLEEVRRTSFGRYTFVVREGASSRDVEVAVVDDPRGHRVAWQALAGARFDGEVRLGAVDARHTRVDLALTADPAGFLAGLAELVRMAHTTTATLDLQRLDDVITKAPA